MLINLLIIELAAERKAARLVRREMGMEGEGEYSDEIQDISDSPEIICEDEDNYEGMEEEEVCVDKHQSSFDICSLSLYL